MKINSGYGIKNSHNDGDVCPMCGFDKKKVARGQMQALEHQNAYPASGLASLAYALGYMVGKMDFGYGVSPKNNSRGSTSGSAVSRGGYGGLDYQLESMRSPVVYASGAGTSHIGDYSGGSGSKYSKMGEDKS